MKKKLENKKKKISKLYIKKENKQIFEIENDLID